MAATWVILAAVGKRARQKRNERPQTAPQPDLAQPAVRRDWTAILVAAGLVVTVLAVYGQCVDHQFLRLDDPDFVSENEHVNSGLSAANIAWAFTAMYASNWHPLTWISHMAVVQIFGLDAGKIILGNVALHAANAVLLFVVLRRATGRMWPSAAVAALFALHPLRVESVAWASERKDVLSTFFFLITLALWVGWVQTGVRGRYWLSIVAFAAGLMSKQMLVSTPLILLLLDWWPFERKISRATLVEKWPFFVLAIGASLITLRAQHAAIGAELRLSVRLSNAVISYAAYLGKMVWPANLSVIYPYRLQVSIVTLAVAAAVLAAISWVAFRSRRQFPFVLFGWLWYVGTLIPVIGIIQVGHAAMADRYTYIPLIGIFVAIAWTCDALMPNHFILAASTAVVLAALAMATFRYVSVWQNGVTLFEHALAVDANRHAHEGLATELLHVHEYSRAAEEYRAALREAPEDDNMHTGLGRALMQLGDAAGARREFETAISQNPRNATALRRLGDLTLAEGKPAEATQLLQRSAAINGDPSTLAVLAAARGNVDEAVRLYRRAIAREPEKAEIRNDLAAVLSKSGRQPEALAEYARALDIDPHNYQAQMNLGALLLRVGRSDESIGLFQRAATERPESSEPHIYLALAYARTNRFDDAIREATAANDINPASANLQFTNALRMPFGEANLAGWIEYLRAQKADAGAGTRPK